MANTVEFHSGVSDKLGFACRLLRKAQQQGKRVCVFGAAELLRALDERLWSFEPLSFVAHARLGPGREPSATLADATRIWLVEPGAAAPHQDIALNLGAQALPDAAAWARVIDVVADDADDRAAGRRRWRAYEAQGCSIQHHPRTAAA